MDEHEHHLQIVEKVWATVDEETAAFAREQPELDHDRIKRDLRSVLAAYMRKERNPTMTSEREYWDGLKQFMEDAYPGESPRGEYEAVYNLDSRVKKRLGWGQIVELPDWDEEVEPGA